MGKSACILGATGLIGAEVARQLSRLEKYEKIILLVRSPLGWKHTKIDEYVIDFDNLSDYAHFFNVDEVYSCLGTTMKKAKSKEAFMQVDYHYTVEAARLAQEEGANTFLTVSSMGANSTSRIPVIQAKGMVEEYLKSCRIPNIIIVRPSFLEGSRPEKRRGEEIGIAFSNGLAKILGKKMRPYQPIKGETVATALITAAQTPTSGITIYENAELFTLAGI